jgi:activator of 2-hydroxyglutaryl-CoA dehydratase
MIQQSQREGDSGPFFLGIDVGSTTLKAVLINELLLL